MATVATIEDRKIKRLIADLDIYINRLKNGQVSYSFRKLIRYRNRINNAFARYIRRRKDEVKKIAREYDLSRRELQQVFRFSERGLISTFERNVQRAFGQAISQGTV